MRLYFWQVILAITLLTSAGCARKSFYASTPVVDGEVFKHLKSNSVPPDSVTIQAGAHYERGFLHRLFWGTHYRPVWAAPVTVPVFEMDTTWGGLTVERKGGGFQTTSFTMVSADNKTYALRSLDKDPQEVLPGFWRKTFVVNILRDQISASNPYGALIIPPLAKAAGIPHATPQLVYVRPNDADFGEHQDVASNKVYMLEEKYTDERMVDEVTGNPVDIVGSGKMLNQVFGEQNHYPNQLAFAKARLFDLLLGDWDRHEGQWEWARYERGGNHYYRPIPKDRDNAFYRFQDGIIPWLFSRDWAIRKFESFDEDLSDVYALTINSRFIDERALAQVTRAQFDSLAVALQQSITDEVIAQAVSQFPAPVHELEGEATKRKLMSRRDQLREAAGKFYEIQAKEVLVVGTDAEDVFEVKRLNDEETAVTVRRKSDDYVSFQRTFHRSETKLITLHGLAGDDEFALSGKVKKGINIKLVGGRGEDEIKDESKVSGWGKKTKVYDTIRGTELEGGPETKDRRTSDVRVHAFDREGF